VHEENIAITGILSRICHTDLNFIYFTTIKKQVISTFINIACWLGWWPEGVVSVGGNQRTWRKPTWSSR